MTVTVVVPSVLAEASGGKTEFELPDDAVTCARDALDAVARQFPVLGRRLRDERGALRRHVNVYVGGEDVRRGDGLETRVAPGAEVLVIQSIAGG
ncbi:MoaD/ThiS family protein [Sinomonas sp. P10A9]|uniref:MoaD/ThiS family protein n=1 Tax=Sinomonas puerhi TaxID=3238584 RepID=A0AB39L593_9MICC